MISVTTKENSDDGYHGGSMPPSRLRSASLESSTSYTFPLPSASSGVGDGDASALLDTIWSDLTVVCWRGLYPEREPTTADLPAPADIVACIGQGGPLSSGPPWGEFLERWSAVASQTLTAGLLNDSARTGDCIITPTDPRPEDEVVVRRGGFDGEEIYRFTTAEWDALPRNLMALGPAHRDIVRTVVTELCGLTDWQAEVAQPEVKRDGAGALLKVCDYFACLPTDTQMEHPLEPLIQAWQTLPDDQRVRHVEPDHRMTRRVMPGKLGMVDVGHKQNGELWSPAAHVGSTRQPVLFEPGTSATVTTEQMLPGFGDHRPDLTPALPLELWDLGAATATRGSGPGAPLPLRLFVESILAVPVSRRHGLNSFAIPLGVLKSRLYPNDTGISRKAFWDRLCRAVDILQSREARIPWYDPVSGKGGLRQVVNITNLPAGPDALHHDVKVVIDLPPNSQAGPQVSDNLGRWGVRSAPAYRALLNLAYQWHQPGRTHYPTGTGGRRHWQRSYDPERYEPMTDSDLLWLCFPAGVGSSQRRKRLALAKSVLAELAASGELQIIPVGQTGRERRILPPLQPYAESD